MIVIVSPAVIVPAKLTEPTAKVAKLYAFANPVGAIVDDPGVNASTRKLYGSDT
jgi:hypothetical protein